MLRSLVGSEMCNKRQEWGSKKYITASLDQSLERMQIEYVDIFYSHRFDPLTPLEETADALALAVHHGKTLYVGISSYSTKQTIIMNKLLAEFLGTLLFLYVILIAGKPVPIGICLLYTSPSPRDS